MVLQDDFDRINLEVIYRFIAEGQEEHLHLDFKTLNQSPMDRDDRKNLAVALSGFANADGGLIVWGIDARARGRNDPDCAKDRSPVTGLSVFLSSLNRYTGEAVNPMVDGVRHKAVPEKDREDSGYAVTLVPASDSGPHMAKLAEDRYYKRSGSRFAQMEHFDIEEMFGRRRRPVLRVASRVVGYGSSAGKLRFKCLVEIENTGRALARFVLLRVKVRAPHSWDDMGVDGNGNHAFTRIAESHDSGWVQFSGGSDIAIHPKATIAVTAVKGHTELGTGDPIKSYGRTAPLVIDYEVAADGFPLTNGTLSVPSEDLESIVAR